MNRRAAQRGLRAAPPPQAGRPSAMVTRRRTASAGRNKPAATLCALLAMGAILSATPPAMTADQPNVTITGGSTDQGHNYTWRVTNRHTSPIVRITFPHYRATVFDVPEGWNRNCAHLLEPGSKDKPGTCTANPVAPGRGIERGTSESFTMRVWQSGTQRTRGIVSVWFADGTQLDISGVELPASESFGDRYVSLLGLGSIFLVWLLVRAVRGRKTARPASAAAPPPQTNG